MKYIGLSAILLTPADFEQESGAKFLIHGHLGHMTL